MKTIEATPAATALAAEEMKQVLNDIAPSLRSEKAWSELMEDCKAAFISEAVAEVNNLLNCNKWLYGDNL